MDAYDIQQKLLEAWREVAFRNQANPGSITKKWKHVPIYVDGSIVKDVVIVEGKIILVTECE